jgi:hypothetical protein
MTLLERRLPVSLLRVEAHRPCTILIAPRISVDLSLAAPSVRVVEKRDRESAITRERVVGVVVENRTAAAPGAAPGEEAARAALAKRYFVSRSTIAEETLRKLRRSTIERTEETLATARRATAELAVEHAALLKRRFQREETTLLLASRQVRRSVAKSAPAAAAETFAPNPAPERARPWPASAQPAAPSLDFIADHVMQQIDRKLVAHRERMGRI